MPPVARIISSTIRRVEVLKSWALSAANTKPDVMSSVPPGFLVRLLHSAANLSRLFTCRQGLDVLGRERLPANPQTAALYLLNHDPSDFTHVLSFDTDHGVGQLFNHLPLLRIGEHALNEFDIN